MGEKYEARRPADDRTPADRAHGEADGPGTYMGAVTALIRYNFIQPAAEFIPYVQGGAGIIYTDAYEDDSQNAIGQSIEFTPQARAGFHSLIFPN